MFTVNVYGGDRRLQSHRCPNVSCAVKFGLSALVTWPGATFDVVAPGGVVVLEMLTGSTTLNDITTALAGTPWLRTV